MKLLEIQWTMNKDEKSVGGSFKIVVALAKLVLSSVEPRLEKRKEADDRECEKSIEKERQRKENGCCARTVS